MHDNVYYLQVGTKPKTTDATLSTKQLERAVNRLRIQNNQLAADNGEHKETIAHLTRVLEACQYELQQLNETERALQQKQSEVEILRYSLSTASSKS